jgi:nucleoside-diphosphate-sugar epimerase
MHAVLGVRAETPLSDGLRKTVEWFRGARGQDRGARRT